MTHLTEKTLSRLNAAVAVPRYDRRDVSTGIVHIGVGNFHRSHQAMYIDTLMNGGAALDWASAVSACSRPTSGCATRWPPRTVSTRWWYATATAPGTPA